MMNRTFGMLGYIAAQPDPECKNGHVQMLLELDCEWKKKLVILLLSFQNIYIVLNNYLLGR